MASAVNKPEAAQHPSGASHEDLERAASQLGTPSSVLLAKAAALSTMAFCVNAVVACFFVSWASRVHMVFMVVCAVPLGMAVPDAMWRTLAKLLLPQAMFNKVQEPGLLAGATWLDYVCGRQLVHACCVCCIAHTLLYSM